MIRVPVIVGIMQLDVKEFLNNMKYAKSIDSSHHLRSRQSGFDRKNCVFLAHPTLLAGWEDD
jgi:hypothetical protein